MKTKLLKYSVFLAGLITIAILNNSCKKEEENILPIITVISPPENSVYTLPDIILVHAEIEDDKLIQSISVVLVDEHLKPVMDPKSYFPKSKTYSLADDYHITDLSLNTGEYYLKIKANDDQCFKNEYTPIFIEGIPKFLKQVIVVTNPGTDTIKVNGITDFETVSELFTIHGDYSASAVSSVYQMFYISGVEKINLQAYNFANLALDWEKEVIPYWPMHNPGCLHFEDLLYVSYDYRDIFGYNFNGVDQYNSKVGEMDAPGNIFKHNNYILCDIQKKNGTDPHISAFHDASGVEAQRLQTNFKVVDFISRNDDLVTIIANSAGYGAIWEYNITNNAITEMVTSNTSFLSSVGVTSNIIYISTPEYIAEYKINNNTFTPVLYESNIKHIVYEEISDLLLAANDTELLLINLPEITNQKTITFSDLIFDIQLLYSK